MKDKQTDSLSAWPDFMVAVRQRLKKGKEEYGDASFTL